MEGHNKQPIAVWKVAVNAPWIYFPIYKAELQV
jgi:hypothetical protein